MKFAVSVVLTALLALALGYYFSWWTVAIAAFVIAGIIRQSPGRSFTTGFLGIFLLWMILCLIINSSNDNILAPKVALILPFGGSVFILILITATVGALAGGMGALCGSLLRRVTDDRR